MKRTWALLALAAWAFMLMGFDGAQRAFVAVSFELDDGEIARLIGVVQLGVLGAAFLLWRADHLGRRWLMPVALALLPLAAVATARAPGLLWFAAAQIAAGASRARSSASSPSCSARRRPRDSALACRRGSAWSASSGPRRGHC